jgi:hypothetical protein
VGGDVPIDSETLLVTDFVNLKIKPTQSFKNARKSMMCVCVFIKMSDYMCINIYVYTMFLKNTEYTSNQQQSSPVGCGMHDGYMATDVH